MLCPLLLALGVGLIPTYAASGGSHSVWRRLPNQDSTYNAKA